MVTDAGLACLQLCPSSAPRTSCATPTWRSTPTTTTPASLESTQSRTRTRTSTTWPGPSCRSAAARAAPRQHCHINAGILMSAATVEGLGRGLGLANSSIMLKEVWARYAVNCYAVWRHLK